MRTGAVGVVYDFDHSFFHVDQVLEMELADLGLEPRQIATDHHAVDQFEIVDPAARVRMVGMLQADGVDTAGPEVGIAGITN